MKHYWVKPYFSIIVVPFNMNMRWFPSVTGVKKESVRADSKHSWTHDSQYTFLVDSSSRDFSILVPPCGSKLIGHNASVSGGGSDST